MTDIRMIDKANHAAGSARDEKARQYRRLYISCFLVFLVITLIDRALPAQWQYRQADMIERKSIVEEARERAGMFVPYLFMNF